MNKSRIAIAILTLSAGGFVGIISQEGYTESAVIPVKGDVPTAGFGTTEGVTLKTKLPPVQAVQRALKDAGKFEGAVKRCVHVPLYQYEYDAAIQLSYNIGPTAFCGSTVVKRFNALDYTGACDAFLMWDKFKGKPLRGLTLRRQRERQLCLGLAAAGQPQGTEKAIASISNREAVPHSLVGKIVEIRPVGQVQITPKVLVHDTDTAIADLVLPTGPTTVLQGVWPVVVLTLDGGPFGRFPHVGEKVLEALPALAHVNAPASVMRVRDGVFVLAALAHTSPDVVGAFPGLPMTQPRGMVDGVAAAGLLPPMQDVVPEGLDFVSAVAAKQPSSLAGALLVFNTANGSQPFELLVSEIAEFHLPTIYHGRGDA